MDLIEEKKTDIDKMIEKLEIITDYFMKIHTNSVTSHQMDQIS